MSLWSRITCRGKYSIEELRAARTILSSEGFKKFYNKFSAIFKSIEADSSNAKFLDLNSDIDSKSLEEYPVEEPVLRKGEKASQKLTALIADKGICQFQRELLKMPINGNESKNCFPNMKPFIIGASVFAVSKFLLRRSLRVSILTSTILTCTAFAYICISAYCTKTPEQQAQDINAKIDYMDIKKPTIENLKELNKLFESTLAKHVNAILYIKDRNNHLHKL